MATSVDSSTLILATLSFPAYWVARSSTIGATERQGPHHGAQKSTSTGTLLFRMSPSKLASETWVTLGFAIDQNSFGRKYARNPRKDSGGRGILAKPGPLEGRASVDVGVDAAAHVRQPLPQEPRNHEERKRRVDPARGREQPGHHRDEREGGVDRAGDRLLGLGREALASEPVARLPLEVPDEGHAEGREESEEEADRARLDARAAKELEGPARERVRREQEEGDADPAGQHLVPMCVVLLLVGQVPEVAHREEGG